MENDTFALGLRQSCEVEDAFARNGWTNQDVKKFTEKDFASSVLLVVQGKATIQVTPPVEQAPPAPFEPKVFKTLTLVQHKSPKDYRTAMEKAGFHIGDWASQIMDKVTVADSEIEVDLVVVTPRKLGFTENTRFDAICERAVSLGLQRPTSEVGPRLRLEYADQPEGEWLVVAMEPLTGSDGGLGLFDVVHNSGERWLFGSNGGPDDVWDLDRRIVFVLPRK